MMNQKFKVVLFSLVLSASVCSFIFLNFCAPEMTNLENQPLTFSEQQIETQLIEAASTLGLVTLLGITLAKMFAISFTLHS